MRNVSVLVFMFACAAPVPASAQAIRGQLVEETTGAPIAGGRVAAVAADGAVAAQGRTDGDGRFLLGTRGAGTYRLRVSAAGYFDYEDGPVDVASRDTVRVELRMGVAAVPIDPVRVVATPRSGQLSEAGFYDRRAANPGHYIDRFAIEERQPRIISDLLRGLNGVQLARSDPRDGPAVQFVMTRAGCLPRILLDGAMVAPGGQFDDARGRTTMIQRESPASVDTRHLRDYALDQIVEPHMIEGLEIFRSSAEIPAQWGGANGGCGLILIWTRRGA